MTDIKEKLIDQRSRSFKNLTVLESRINRGDGFTAVKYIEEDLLQNEEVWFVGEIKEKPIHLPAIEIGFSESTIEVTTYEQVNDYNIDEEIEVYALGDEEKDSCLDLYLADGEPDVVEDSEFLPHRLRGQEGAPAAGRVPVFRPAAPGKKIFSPGTTIAMKIENVGGADIRFLQMMYSWWVERK